MLQSVHCTTPRELANFGLQTGWLVLYVVLAHGHTHASTYCLWLLWHKPSRGGLRGHQSTNRADFTPESSLWTDRSLKGSDFSSEPLIPQTTKPWYGGGGDWPGPLSSSVAELGQKSTLPDFPMWLCRGSTGLILVPRKKKATMLTSQFSINVI